MKSNKMLLYILLVGTLSSCRVYDFTTDIEEQYRKIEPTLTKRTGNDFAPQFFNSRKIILEYQSIGMTDKDKEKMKENMLVKGKLDKSYKRQIDKIVIKKKTPGICVQDKQDGILAIRFDPEYPNRVLYFSYLTNKNGLYLLMKNNEYTIGPDHLIDYGGKTYKMIIKDGPLGLFNASKYIKLLVEKDSNITVKKSKKTAKGITVQDVNKGKIDF